MRGVDYILNAAKIFAESIEPSAVEQVRFIADSCVGGLSANIRVMPDAHVGVAGPIGLTMKVTDKIVPNLVGVDIGCGVRLAKFDIDFKGQLEKLDKVIRQSVPHGMKNNDKKSLEVSFFYKLKCWNELPSRAIETAVYALGSLGGGNHFIEAYEDGYISVHSGSRNIGLTVAKYYQELAQKRQAERVKTELQRILHQTPEIERERVIKEWKTGRSAPKGLEYLEGKDLEDYLHDQLLMVEFARMNREEILRRIAVGMRAKIIDSIESTHNYISKDRVLRKGAISAAAGEQCLIPLNMRDGLLVCLGKGNEDWNCSAPHGAGRLYSRSVAKTKFTVSAYKETMEGIFSTCIDENTLDEAPFVYKDMQEIIKAVGPTVEITTRLLPIYNFKATE